MSKMLPEVIATRILIPGPDGRPRIEIGLVDGEPAIRMFDDDGNVRVRLGLERDGDPDPQYGGILAELRLAGGVDDGEAVLAAGHGHYAAIEIRTEGPGTPEPGAAAWLEATAGGIEATIQDLRGGTHWSFNTNRPRGRYDAPSEQPNG